MTVQSVSDNSLISTVVTDVVAVFNLTAYLPDSFLPQFEDVKHTVVSWLKTFGVIRGDDSSSGPCTSIIMFDYVTDESFQPTRHARVRLSPMLKIFSNLNKMR